MCWKGRWSWNGESTSILDGPQYIMEGKAGSATTARTRRTARPLQWGRGPFTGPASCGEKKDTHSHHSHTAGGKRPTQGKSVLTLRTGGKKHQAVFNCLKLRVECLIPREPRPLQFCICARRACLGWGGKYDERHRTITRHIDDGDGGRGKEMDMTKCHDNSRSRQRERTTTHATKRH